MGPAARKLNLAKISSIAVAVFGPCLLVDSADRLASEIRQVIDYLRGENPDSISHDQPPSEPRVGAWIAAMWRRSEATTSHFSRS